MSQEIIRHRRLYAFYNSRVLNLLMILIIASLMLADATPMSVFPLMCTAVLFLLFVGYSLWLWIKKPRHIVIDARLSDFSGLLVVYFIIGPAFPDGVMPWWNFGGLLVAFLFLLISFVWPKAQTFDI